MSNLKVIVGIGLVVIGGYAPPTSRTASAQQYVITDLGANADPFAVNRAGQVAGGVFYSSTSKKVTTSYSRAFVWTPSVPNGVTGNIQMLGTLGGTSSTARGVGDDGSVVGRANTAQVDASGYPIVHAYVWNRSGGMLDLNTMFGPDGVSAAALGWTLSEADAINARGQVVGKGTSANWPGVSSFLWERDGSGNVRVTPMPLNDNEKSVIGGVPIDRMGLNAAGQVAQYAHDASGYRRACVWSRDAAGNGTLTFPPFLASGSHSEATDINNAAFDSAGNLTRPAQAVGLSSTYSLNPPFRAFLWDAVSGAHDLGTLGGSLAVAYGINDASQVIGWSSDSTGVGRRSRAIVAFRA